MTLQPLHNPSGDLAPAGLTLQDQRRIQDALDSSMSAKTRRSYNQAWRQLKGWRKQRGPGHSLPAQLHRDARLQDGARWPSYYQRQRELSKLGRTPRDGGDTAAWYAQNPSPRLKAKTMTPRVCSPRCLSRDIARVIVRSRHEATSVQG